MLGQNKIIKRDGHIHYYQDIAFVQLCVIFCITYLNNKKKLKQKK